MKKRVYYNYYYDHKLVLRFREENESLYFTNKCIETDKCWNFTSKQQLINFLKSQEITSFRFIDYQAFILGIEPRKFDSIEKFASDPLPATRSDVLYKFTILVTKGVSGDTEVIQTTAATDVEALRNARVTCEGTKATKRYDYMIQDKKKVCANERVHERTPGENNDNEVEKVVIDFDQKPLVFDELTDEDVKGEPEDLTDEDIKESKLELLEQLVYDALVDKYGEDFAKWLKELAVSKELTLVELALTSLTSSTKGYYKECLRIEMERKLKALGD